MTIRGKFISIEGIDGAGKTTFAQFLADTLQTHGIKSKAVSGTIHTDFSKNLVKLLLTEEERKEKKRKEKKRKEHILSADVTAILFSALHLQTYQTRIKPLLDKGVWVIADRFFDSTLAHHGYGNNNNTLIKNFFHLQQFAFQNASPDLTFLLTLPILCAQTRIKERKEANAFDKKSLSYFKRVQNGFLNIAKQETNRIKVVSNNSSIENTKKKLLKQLYLNYPQLLLNQNGKENS